MSNFRGQVQGFAVGVLVVASVVGGGQMLDTPSPKPEAPLVTPAAMAEAMNVKLVWGIGACGDYLPSYMRFNGCSTGSTIYLATDLDAETQHRVMLHEIGHVIQYRLGIEREECGADTFAAAYGGEGKGLGCKP